MQPGVLDVFPARAPRLAVLALPRRDALLCGAALGAALLHLSRRRRLFCGLWVGGRRMSSLPRGAPAPE
eukprot:532993-Alexandrium_andersonii.AAC.1